MIAPHEIANIRAQADRLSLEARTRINELLDVYQDQESIIEERDDLLGRLSDVSDDLREAQGELAKVRKERNELRQKLGIKAPLEQAIRGVAR